MLRNVFQRFKTLSKSNPKRWMMEDKSQVLLSPSINLPLISEKQPEVIKTLNKDVRMFRILALNKQGTLAKILERIVKYSFDFTNCESSYVEDNIRFFELHLYLREHAKEVKLNEQFMKDLLDGLCVSVEELPSVDLPEFPTKLEDLNAWVPELQNPLDGLSDDHPGKNDPVYLKRRNEIGDFCESYKMLESIPRVNYLPHEKDLWRELYSRLRPLIEAHGSKKFVENLKKLEKDRLYELDDIPQLDEINKFLISKNNWRIKPVNGILSQRQFLNSLAFRTFCSTQYLRHHSAPLFTPEPDIFHEFLGHVPMFIDPDFCDISQKLGKI